MLKLISSHVVVCIAAVAISWGVLHAFYSEHEARALAEQTVKQQDSSIKSSQLAIAQLESEIEATNAHAAAADRALRSALATVKTPAQAVASIPSVSDVPLNARVTPDNPAQVSVDAVALYQELNKCSQGNNDLAACQKNINDMALITAEKDKELASDKAIVAAYKKQNSFLHRLKSTLKDAGIGLAIGLALGAHFL